MDIVRFYLSVIWGVPWLLWQSAVTVEGLISVLVFVVAPIVGVEVINRWLDLHLSRKKYAFFAIGFYFVLLLLKSNYDAFDSQKMMSAADIKALNEKVDGVLAELKIRNVLNDQLTKENGALAAGGRVLTDAQVRIEAIRKQFLEHADKAPVGDKFKQDAAWNWYIEANSMKEQTLSDDSRLYLWGGFNKNKVGYDDFLQSVGTMRAIAINVTEKDLRDNTRKQ